MLSYIVWDINPEIFTIPGINFPLRYYSLFFALGFIISQQIMFYFFRKDGRPQKDVDTLTIYMVVATVIGARLGHVIFYEPEIFVEDPIGVIRFWNGGLSGLASHGGAFGILFALWLYARKRPNQSYFWILDRIVIVVALTGCLIRLGNFMNSEIVGKPTNSQYGVVFARLAEEWIMARNDAILDVEAEKGGTVGETPVTLDITVRRNYRNDMEIDRLLQAAVQPVLTSSRVIEDVYLPPGQEPKFDIWRDPSGVEVKLQAAGIARHPSQLYESSFYLALFLVLFFLWKRYRTTWAEGKIFGIFLIALFGFRFLVEFVKADQVAFEADIPLNMGQWLSIPLVLAGIFVLIYVSRKHKETHANVSEN
ncbi:prolipoprotein diacylglyceryl transferase [Catalinimonas alkaloidigena]|uniref:Phosphatidylglycerol--prolipoprotein diacylglyceryl transferase n=1 Tax=Catalinimonas alkaloidigena TaxID=1075417 RepID=A0A1G9EL82_9BACT|nr:prolipoprotein diacylglyceryl transferase [Catalinimonas alkaloidigena]SDK76957.1 prolipoprotein diacylglyceryl transferase [Catalinimonas alkaloidigena]